jgi:NADH:ubiquinone oxidoreductase subunit 5 (subunit L)/multisubunit Na+/H+ antiporter MnhA subunit
MSLDLLPLGAPLLLLAAAAVGFLGPTRGRPARLKLVEGLSVLAVGIALVAASLLVGTGPRSSELLGLGGLGLSIRLDAVSVVMLVLVSFIGWVVVRYARVYLDGEARQGTFLAWLDPRDGHAAGGRRQPRPARPGLDRD